MASKSKKKVKKFNGPDMKVQNKSEQHVLSIEQKRLKKIMGEGLYRDATHFCNFDENFENSLVFKRMLNEFDEGRFDEYHSPIDFAVACDLDPILILSYRMIYGYFQSAVKSYHGGKRLFESYIKFVMPNMKKHQMVLRVKMGGMVV